MRAGPVGRAMRGGVARRRVQTIVIALVLLVSTGASVLALALVVDSSAPFDHSFAAQRGAHLAVIVDPARATPADVAATTEAAAGHGRRRPVRGGEHPLPAGRSPRAGCIPATHDAGRAVRAGRPGR